MAARLHRPISSQGSRSKPDVRRSDAELAVDFAAIVLMSVAVTFMAQRLVLMSVLTPVVFMLRMLLWRRVTRTTTRTLRAECAFLALCTVIGGFNDWNTVVHHGVYAYDVPVFVPGLSTIPLWMLLYWGLILRFLLSLALWRRLGEATTPAPRLRVLRTPAVRVAVLLGLVLITRQCIYVAYQDPLWSWLPFLFASVVYVALLGLSRADLALCAFMLVAGPAIEALYIQQGHLHHYALGWIGGVPLWIALWWLLGVLVWKDIGGRMLRQLERWSVRAG